MTGPADIADPGGFWNSDAEAKASFLLRLRAKGVRDLAVLRAMEAVRRADFVPRRYADLAGRQIALPIGCGQTMSEPFFVARVLEALACTAGARVFEVGAGSGYVTALLARLSGTVLTVERFQSLALEARARLAGLGVGNAEVLWADGLDLGDDMGTFDRIVVHAAVTEAPLRLLGHLSTAGVMVYSRTVRRDAADPGRQLLLRVTRDAGGDFSETVLGGSRLQAAQPGKSRLL